MIFEGVSSQRCQRWSERRLRVGSAEFVNLIFLWGFLSGSYGFLFRGIFREALGVLGVLWGHSRNHTYDIRMHVHVYV